MWGRKKFWIAGSVLAVAMGALVFNAVAGSSLYYYTVSEFRAQGPALQDQEVRVDGLVAPTPIQWDAQTRTTQFTLQDKDNAQERLPVVYRGALPDTFKVGAEVVVRGKLNAQGIFEGNELQARCASRYIALP